MCPSGKENSEKLHVRAEIERHDRLYSKDSRPEISDFEYNCLKSELLCLESLLPEEGDKIGLGNDRSGDLLTCDHYRSAYNCTFAFICTTPQISDTGSSPEYLAPLQRKCESEIWHMV
jgi:hypothetical protein